MALVILQNLEVLKEDLPLGISIKTSNVNFPVTVIICLLKRGAKIVYCMSSTIVKEVK